MYPPNLIQRIAREYMRHLKALKKVFRDTRYLGEKEYN